MPVYSALRSTILVLLVAWATFSGRSVSAQPIRVLMWNVESGGAEPAAIARRLAMMAGYDIYALTEVDLADVATFQTALGPEFGTEVSLTGDKDRLLLLYDFERFEMLKRFELSEFKGIALNSPQQGHRTPMVVRLRDRRTRNRLVIALNHLARGDVEMRRQQATGLREWGRDQKLPTLALGDFNFDYHFPTKRGNRAMDIMLEDDIWYWVRPHKLVDTNWSDRDGDGKDDYPDSCLTFGLVTRIPTTWKLESAVIVRKNDFPDSDVSSDHRAVELIVTMD